MLFRVIRITVAVYVGLTALMAVRQRHYIYHPARLDADAAKRLAGLQGFRAWRDAAGDLIGWRRAAAAVEASHRRRVVVFHGNAGHALNRDYFAQGFEQIDDAWEVLLFEYPGFGARAGRPSERRILHAAGEAIDALLREDATPLFLVGESLGSGVASAMAERFGEQIAGLWLVTPFTSLADAARAHYPFLPVRLVLRDRYDNVKALRGYQGKVLILAAERDRVVPAALARSLFEQLDTPHKLWVEQSGADHNTLDILPGAPIWQRVNDFWLNPATSGRNSRPDS